MIMGENRENMFLNIYDFYQFICLNEKVTVIL